MAYLWSIHGLPFDKLREPDKIRERFEGEIERRLKEIERD